MSQAELARALLVQQNVVARLEDGGRADPRFSTVIAISEALGISLDALAAEAGLTAARPSREAIRGQLLEATRIAKLARAQLADLDQTLAQFDQPRTRVRAKPEPRRRK